MLIWILPITVTALLIYLILKIVPTIRVMSKHDSIKYQHNNCNKYHGV